MDDKLTVLLHKSNALEKRFDQMDIRADLNATRCWINAYSTADDYHRVQAERERGTCDWILEKAEFKAWFASGTPSKVTNILWIRGKPGSGKTFLTARIIDHLKCHATVAYFFCSYGHARKRRPLEILKSWVLQLIEANEIACKTAKEAFQEKASEIATESEVWRIFKRIVLQVQCFYFVVDGFDECLGEDESTIYTTQNARERHLTYLSESVAQIGVKILFVSRHDLDIDRSARNTIVNSVQWVKYDITEGDTKVDIQIYAGSIINRTLSNKPEELRNELATAVSERCEGMFLWVYLTHKQLKLKRSSNTKTLRAIISDTPAGLENFFERTLKGIVELDTEEKNRAISILRWVMHAMTPLTVREITEALLVSVDKQDVHGFFPQDELPEEYDEWYRDDMVLRPCGPFIHLRGAETNTPIMDQTLHFVHFSIKEYLSSESIEAKFPELGRTYLADTVGAHKLLAEVCLRYLYYDDFIQITNSTEEEFDKKLDKFAFLGYAAWYWLYHKICCPVLPTEIVDWTNKLLDPQENKWISFSEVIGARSNGSFRRFMSRYRESYPNPLYYASIWGLLPTMKFLIDQRDAPINKPGGLYGSPLQAASAMGFTDSVKLLLQNNADVNIIGGRWSHSLQAAAVKGHIDVVETLLDNNARVDIKGGPLTSALLAAATFSNASSFEMSIITRLLEAGSNIHDKTENGYTALHLAALHDNLALFSLLLVRGAHVNALSGDRRAKKSDFERMTPLHIASWKGDEEIVNELIIYGANVEARTTNGKQSLHLAADAGQGKVMKILLSHGADVNARADGQMTPLLFAAQSGHCLAVELLLAEGADIEAQGYEHGEYIDYGKHYEDGEVEETVFNGEIEEDEHEEEETRKEEMEREDARDEADWEDENNGENEDNCSQYGLRALHLAAINGHLHIANLLLSYGADIEATFDNSETALCFAAICNQIPMMKLLIDQGAKVSSLNSRAVKQVMRRSTIQVVEHLRKSGVQDGLLLHGAVAESRHEALQFLIENGVTVDTPDSDGYSPLILAAHSGDLTSVATLVCSGADIDKKGPMGDTACTAAMAGKYIDIVDFLIDNGADLHIRDSFGRNCFDWIAALNWDNVKKPVLPKDHPITTPDVARDIQNKSIRIAVAHIQKLLGSHKEKSAQYRSWYSTLGHLLLFRENLRDACTAFEQYYIDTPRQAHRANLLSLCDACDSRHLRNIIRERFVCCKCTNIDLCPPCMEKYRIGGRLEMDAPELCVGHEFLRVPSVGWRDLVAGQVNPAGQSEGEWLESLANLYGG